MVILMRACTHAWYRTYKTHRKTWMDEGRTLVGAAVPMVTMAQSAANWRITWHTLAWIEYIHSHSYINTELHNHVERSATWAITLGSTDRHFRDGLDALHRGGGGQRGDLAGPEAPWFEGQAVGEVLQVGLRQRVLHPVGPPRIAAVGARLALQGGNSHRDRIDAYNVTPFPQKLKKT